jgi:hypothetical protein
MEAVYAAIPVYLADQFAVYEGDEKPVVIVWLVPISATEASYVRRYGWPGLRGASGGQRSGSSDVFRAPLPTDDWPRD